MLYMHLAVLPKWQVMGAESYRISMQGQAPYQWPYTAACEA